MKHLIMCAAVLALGACATAPTTQYYHLSDSAYRLPAGQKQTVSLKVVLAEPLKSGSLLYQNDAHTLHFAKQHLWAEPLDVAVGHQLANALNAQQPTRHFVPPSLQTSGTPELVVYIDRFQGRFDGQTQITGYSVWHRDGHIQPNTGFDVHTPQQGDGYAAMTTSLSRGLEEVAKHIAY